MLIALRLLYETTSSGITGSMAVTDGTDTLSFSGDVASIGTVAVTDGADVSAASGSITTTGNSGTTDGADVSAASGTVASTASSATTDGADVMAASGTVLSGVGGSMAVTDDVDVMAASGSVSGQSQPSEVPAGASRRRVREIYRVTIDGQTFEFKSLEAAVALLEQAKRIAAEEAARTANEAAEAQSQSAIDVPMPTLRAPRIEVNSRELRAAASATRRQIEAIYEKALVDAELRMLFEIEKRQEDNEDALLLLL